MIINRQIRAENILNSCLQNCEKFNFDEYCNYFRFQNDVVLRIIIKNNGIGSAKSTFFSTLNSFNNYIIGDNFLGVLAIVYYEDGTDNTVIEANFNQRWDKKDDIIGLAFDFLCCIPELDYDLEKFPVKNIKKYFYEKALNKSLIVSNIADLLQYNQNKTFHEIIFRGWEIKELQKNINYALSQYNLSHRNAPLFMQGVLNKIRNNVILKAYFACKEKDKNRVLSLIAKILEGLEAYIMCHSVYDIEDPKAIIYGEFLNGGIMVGNIEEPIGLP